MINFFAVFADLFLSRIPGYYRMLGFLSDFRSSQIPYNQLPRKLNLGCSTTWLSGYTNVDARADCNPDIVSNVRQLTFAEDASYDLVRASHVLEHFHPNDLLDVLTEWRRVLRPGGFLVLCVPDHSRLSWRSLLAPKKLFISQFSNGWMSGLFALDLPPEFRHQSVFTEASLRALLEEAGFVDTHVLQWRNEDPFAQGLEDNSCSPYSLNVVTRKPG